MNPLVLIPTEWKLIAGAFGIVALLGSLGAVGVAIEKHGYDKAAAIYQPKLDAANKDIGILSAANATDEATIHALHADQQANDALVQQYAVEIANSQQQADDVAATIRKLQADDKTVDAYLRTPVPDALRGVLNDPGTGYNAGPANQGSNVAAAH